MSSDEIIQLKFLLSKLEPGVVPLPIFQEITRFWVTAVVEVIPVRMEGGKVQVLLTRREATDQVWPNKLHVPGTVLRATDGKGDFRDAFNRIFKEELGCKEEVLPVFTGNRFVEGDRGSELGVMYYTEINGKTSDGQWYDVDNLPGDLIEYQIVFIKKAVKCFESNKTISE